jgi:type I restriction enzyme R subunit
MQIYVEQLVKPLKRKVSVLDDVDFQLDLLHSDRINVGYILTLLQMAVNAETDEQRKKYEAQVHDLIGSDISLHDKQDLIQKFIEENMPKMINGQRYKCFCSVLGCREEQAYQHFCEKKT